MMKRVSIVAGTVGLSLIATLLNAADAARNRPRLKSASSCAMVRPNDFIPPPDM